MTLTVGFDHIALLTGDLDRLIAFYGSVFDATVRFDIADGGQRHAAIELGDGTYLHAFEAPENDHASGSDASFARGHLDHVSLHVAAETTFQTLRRRLVACGASDGTVIDWGLCRQVVFTDPDGCVSEITIAADGPVRSYAERGLEPFPAGA